MNLRKYAMVSGVAYVALGLLSFVPALSTRPRKLPRMKLRASYGLFAGLFPQNVVNKIALTAFGIAGIAAARSGRGAVAYARAVSLVMGGAAALGVIPATRTGFGYWPLWGNEAALHAVNAAIGGYFGFGPPAAAERIRYRFVS